MSLTHSHPVSSTDTRPRHKFRTGRSEFVVVALLYALAVSLTLGTISMHVLGTAVPGPQFFPYIVCALLYATATALAVDILRNPRLPDTEPHPGHGDFSTDMLRDLGDVDDERTDARPGPMSARWATYSDWKTVGQVAGAVAVFILLLNPLGWILCAAFLFWIVAHALGSTRPVFDLGVALLFSSTIQLAFSAGLGLPLPSGFMGGML
jgi:putative tricarboxylic transport membrane protein